jgi:hypothetical protein
MCYDGEALKPHGEKAVLSFPPGSDPCPTFTTSHSKNPLVRGEIGRGRASRVTDASLPAGICGGMSVPIPENQETWLRGEFGKTLWAAKRQDGWGHNPFIQWHDYDPSCSHPCHDL